MSMDESDIEFTMPTCHRHFFKGHRWWCRACDRETMRQFRDVCEDLWQGRCGDHGLGPKVAPWCRLPRGHAGPHSGSSGGAS